MQKITMISMVIIYLLFSSAFALTPSTGDKVLDSRLDAVNTYAEKKRESFVASLSKTYHVEKTEIEGMLNKGMTPADVYMTLRVAQVTGQSAVQVEKGYLHNKAKGWGVISKSLGIKPGSEAFQSLKSGAGEITGKGKAQGHEKGKVKGMNGKSPDRSDGPGHGKGNAGGSDSHGNGGGKSE